MYMNEKILQTLQKHTRALHTPIDDLKAVRQNNHFRTLIQTILTAQTRDSLTAPITKRLFENVGETPKDFAVLSEDALMEQIYPITYYKTKAKHIIRTCQILIEKYNGEVPNSFEELVTLPGVGPKTASVVMCESFNVPTIIVDTHVHRISNRLGFIQTKTREQTLATLQQQLPKKWWSEYNTMLVKHGQTICTPISPQCSACPVSHVCPKKGVTHSR